MKTDLIEYLSDAISRAEAGGVSSPSGSWMAGVFGKAANLFEKQLRSYATGLLAACELAYPGDLREAVKGSPPYEKLTLGQLVALIRAAGKRKPQSVAQRVPGGSKLTDFLEAAQKVNDAWVVTKHGEEIREEILLAQMRTMLMLSKQLRAKN